MKKVKIQLVIVLFLLISGMARSQDTFIGEIKMFAGNFAPQGYALCNGQLLQISQHQALFSIIGTTYGGDGQVTFALPDLRGRAPIHAGTGPGLSPRNLGSSGGLETTTLTVNNLPSHSHTVNAISATGNSNSPTGNLPASTGFLDNEYSNATTPAATMGAGMIGSTGNGQAANNMQPYVTINYIIALQGVYPSPN